MTGAKPVDDENAKRLVAEDPDELKGTMKALGGSRSDHWNDILGNQALRTLWTAYSDERIRNRQINATVAALAGIAPRDELEAMLAAQLLGAHNAAMECYRRAMLKEQTFEGHREALSQASKLSRTYTLLLEALNRHRGKGQQKVTVEHVHVHSGGRAMVGMVESGAKSSDSKEPHDAKQISHAPQPAMRSARSRRPCQAPAMPNGRCRMHGGLSPGAPKGNKNALKHGHYTAEAIARRREISGLLRAMKALARTI